MPQRLVNKLSTYKFRFPNEKEGYTVEMTIEERMGDGVQLVIGKSNDEFEHLDLVRIPMDGLLRSGILADLALYDIERNNGLNASNRVIERLPSDSPLLDLFEQHPDFKEGKFR